MEELQSELNEKIAIRDSWMINGRNEEQMNDEIRELQRKIREFSLTRKEKRAIERASLKMSRVKRKYQ